MILSSSPLRAAVVCAARAAVPASVRAVATLLALLFLASGAGAQQRAQGIQSGDLHRLHSVTDVQLSPDGGLIAYVVSNRQGPGRPSSQIWLMEGASGQARRLGTEAETGSGPSWSPDGRWIAYSGRSGGRSGVVVSRPDGSEARLVAEVMGTNHPLPRSGSSTAWSPDSRQIGFVSATPGPEPEEESEAGDPIVIRRYTYKTTGSDGFSYFAWSPNGEEILFVSNREPDHDVLFPYDLFAVRVADGRIRQLSSLESVVYDPR